MRMNEPGWIWSDAGPVSGLASVPFGLARRRRGGRGRLHVHFVELIFLGARLRQANDHGQRSQSTRSGKAKSRLPLPVLESRSGEASSCGTTWVEGDITTYRRISAVIRLSLRHPAYQNSRRPPVSSAAIQSSLSRRRDLQQAIRHKRGSNSTLSTGEQDLPHGSYLSFSRLALQSFGGPPGRRGHAALRQDHSGHAAGLLPAQPLQPGPHHPRTA